MDRSSKLIAFFLTASFSTFLALSLSHAAAVPEFDGAQCVEDNDCEDCNTGTITGDTSCPNGLRCSVSQGSASQVTFRNCQPTGNSSDICYPQSRANPNGEKCKQMSVWLCGCQILFSDAYVCNYEGDCDCPSDGEDPDGTGVTLTLQTYCTL